jgi:dihydroorotate dehydrogenase (fumarate)
MTDMQVRYMGLMLNNPVVVGACSLSSDVDRIRRVEQAGAGALVIKSLFEEQLLYESNTLEQALRVGAESFPEALTYFPPMEHGAAKEHLFWVEKARKAVDMPLIASINAVRPGQWTDFARQLQETGVDGLELNVYSVAADFEQAQDEEARVLETFEAVRDAVSLPVAVKLSPFYSSVGRLVKELDERGARAVVLFNRFLQPDIDASSLKPRVAMDFSVPSEMRTALRWIALLYGKLGADLAGSTGVRDANDVVKYLLAGATAVQTVSALYIHDIEYVQTLVNGLEQWMQEHDFEAVEDFRGRVCAAHLPGDAHRFERAQYMKVLASVG